VFDRREFFKFSEQACLTADRPEAARLETITGRLSFGSVFLAAQENEPGFGAEPHM
jgi:hypothetical protein